MREKHSLSPNSAIGRLYEQYRREFTAFAYNRYDIDEDEAADIFQEGFIAFYYNLSGGRLRELTCSLRTYIFQICKYKILHGRRKESQLSFTDLSAVMDNHYSREQVWDERQQLVYELVGDMQEPCNRILAMFYCERMSMGDISGAMNYGNEQVARNRKTMCLKKLRDNITLREKQ